MISFNRSSFRLKKSLNLSAWLNNRSYIKHLQTNLISICIPFYPKGTTPWECALKNIFFGECGCSLNIRCSAVKMSFLFPLNNASASNCSDGVKAPCDCSCSCREINVSEYSTRVWGISMLSSNGFLKLS